MLCRAPARSFLHLARGSSRSCRSFYSATAQFTTVDKDGQSVSRDTDIIVGERHETYVYIEPEVGNAMRSAILRTLEAGDTTSPAETKTLPLRFDHGSRSFTHKSGKLPRLDIPQDLGPSKSSDPPSAPSPATLWLSGKWHAITLDGTFDADFERVSRESATDLEGALEKLRDN